MADSLILMVLGLVVLGPRRLPQVGRQIGKLMFEFRKASNDFKFQMEEELRMSEEAERKLKEDAARTRVLLDQAAVSAQPLQDPTAIPAAEPAQAAPAQEELHMPRVADPVIQPPSTGETVAAEKPNAEPPTSSSPTETVTQHV